MIENIFPKAENRLVPKNIDLKKAIKVLYINWKGETAKRIIVPIEIFWGSTEFHTQEQWLMKVWDIDREAYRNYALRDIKEWL